MPRPFSSGFCRRTSYCVPIRSPLLPPSIRSSHHGSYSTHRAGSNDDRCSEVDRRISQSKTSTTGATAVQSPVLRLCSRQTAECSHSKRASTGVAGTKRWCKSDPQHIHHLDRPRWEKCRRITADKVQRKNMLGHLPMLSCLFARAAPLLVCSRGRAARRIKNPATFLNSRHANSALFDRACRR